MRESDYENLMSQSQKLINFKNDLRQFVKISPKHVELYKFFKVIDNEKDAELRSKISSSKSPRILFSDAFK